MKDIYVIGRLEGLLYIINKSNYTVFLVQEGPRGISAV